MNNMDMVDVSDNIKKKKDKFMIFIYISLVILVLLSIITYFFLYDFLKPYIKL